jgi:hypothetical protein
MAIPTTPGGFLESESARPGSVDDAQDMPGVPARERAINQAG